MIAGSSLERGIFYLNDKLGRFIPWGLRNRCAQLLYPQGKAKPRILTVDLSGSCNLRCPSCPVGSIGQLHPQGFMDVAHFTHIITKAKREHAIRIVALHNWTEPFLHPQLPELIRIVKAHGLVCALSTNMTIRRHIEEVVAAAPDLLRISLSGFTQESYATTHVRGNIEHVKDNMRLLSVALARAGRKRTQVTVFYHKYRHNLDEMEQMRSYAKQLGFAWEDSWAYYMSLEKIQALLAGKLTPEEQDFVDNRLALPISKALDAARAQPANQRCTLLEDQIVLDHRGQVSLCCAVYDQTKNTLGNFMAMGEDELKKAKQNHDTCRSCAGNNLHLYFTYYDVPALKNEYARLAQENLEHREKI